MYDMFNWWLMFWPTSFSPPNPRKGDRWLKDVGWYYFDGLTWKAAK